MSSANRDAFASVQRHPVMQCMGRLGEHDLGVLRAALQQSHEHLGRGWLDAMAARQLFWVNLCQEDGDAGLVRLFDVAPSEALARHWMARCFGEDVLLNGFGFSACPPGAMMQEWHIDYHCDMANLFIPLTPLQAGLGTQYVVPAPDCPPELLSRAMADPDKVDITVLLEGGCALEICECLAPVGSVLKMDFGAIHRGPANRTDSERTMFWVSVRRRHGTPLACEPLIHHIT